eukprot:1276302-Amphidinium_carterae.2
MGDVGRLQILTLSQALGSCGYEANHRGRHRVQDAACRKGFSHNAAKSRLGDVYTTGIFEPSSHLISILYVMKDRGEWAHLCDLPLSSCASRRQELSGSKVEEHLKLVGGLLKVVKDEASEAEVNTPLLARQAFTRRALAFEVVGLGTFEVHGRYANELFSHLQELVPAHHAAPSLARLMLADSELWALMAENIKNFGSVNGVLPIDQGVDRYKDHARVQFHLAMLPSPVTVPAKRKELATNAMGSTPKVPRKSVTPHTSTGATNSKGKGRANRTPKLHLHHHHELVGLAFTGQCLQQGRLQQSTLSAPAHLCALRPAAPSSQVPSKPIGGVGA